MDYCVVLVTCRDRDEAERIAGMLVDRGQAACVNIFSGVVSVFRWQGKKEQADEVLLMIKTRAALFERVRATVREGHSYQTPEVIALPVLAGDQAYLDWIEQETRDKID